MNPRHSIANNRLIPRNNAGDRRKTLISLTPLIDVVFILLIFFMLASNFLDWRTISLDAPAQAGTGSSTDGALLIRVKPDGLDLNGISVSPSELTERLVSRLARDPEQRILIQPSQGVSLQRAVDLLDRLSGLDGNPSVSPSVSFLDSG